MRARATNGPDGAGASERGAAIVEAAIALPLCVLLFMGMLAAGSLMKAYSSSTAAVRAAGRMASLAGADPMSDQMALARLAREGVGIRPDPVDFVVIWHAAGPSDPPPAACLPTGVLNGPNTTSLGVTDGGTDAMGACNIYLRPADPGGAFDMAQGFAAQPASYYFGCQGSSDPAASHMVDCRWPGKDRRALTTPRIASGPPVSPDFVGLELQLTHRFGANLFGAVTMHSSVVNLIEPHGYALS